MAPQNKPNPLKTMNFFLAKKKRIYYPMHRKELVEIVRISKYTLLVFLFSLIPFQTTLLAGTKQEAAENYRLKAYEAQQKGNLDEALSLYVKATSLGLQDASIYNEIGIIYEQMGLSKQAEEYYLKALKEDRGFLPAYTNLGYLYKGLKKYKKAAEYFKQRADWGNPDDSWTTQAKTELKELAKYVPDLQEYLLRKEVEALNRTLETQIQKEFAHKIIVAKKLFEKGREFERHKQFRRAIESYRRALSYTPDNPEIIKAKKEAELKWMRQKVDKGVELAKRYLDMGDTFSAKIEFRKILSIIPDEPFQIPESLPER